MAEDESNWDTIIIILNVCVFCMRSCTYREKKLIDLYSVAKSNGSMGKSRMRSGSLTQIIISFKFKYWRRDKQNIGPENGF